MLPMAYAVPIGYHDKEKRNPNSVKRDVVGKLPHIWGQSLYIVARLLSDKLLNPGEIDPLNRRMSTHKKPEVVVQVAILALNEKVKGNDFCKFNKKSSSWPRSLTFFKPIFLFNSAFKNNSSDNILR